MPSSNGMRPRHPSEKRIRGEMLISLRVERRRAAVDAVHLITLMQKKFRQMGSVLTGHARNQCLLQCPSGKDCSLEIKARKFPPLQLIATCNR